MQMIPNAQSQLYKMLQDAFAGGPWLAAGFARVGPETFLHAPVGSSASWGEHSFSKTGHPRYNTKQTQTNTFKILQNILPRKN